MNPSLKQSSFKFFASMSHFTHKIILRDRIVMFKSIHDPNKVFPKHPASMQVQKQIRNLRHFFSDLVDIFQQQKSFNSNAKSRVRIRQQRRLYIQKFLNVYSLYENLSINLVYKTSIFLFKIAL